MEYAQRLYDSELYAGTAATVPSVPEVCPECGAMLDAEDDLIYLAGEGEEYVVGCARCIRARVPCAKGAEDAF